MTALAGWENFYVIVGSSAGALIGLQFVVMTLIADRPPERSLEAGAAFLAGLFPAPKSARRDSISASISRLFLSNSSSV